ncbi:Sieve element occlusion b [Thalictrum thalictroides]|uniref:Sieve element occlusion b n=1 Tax=Thalictrum thalictroides TaxID=46969 RepID=A0A7J6VQ56_THATH|nr:Sieve element occlusion b [Thalictrum thalictroides]
MLQGRAGGFERELLDLIQATHAPADDQEFNLKPLLNVVEKIFQDASTFGIEGLSHPNSEAQIDAVTKLSSEISRISSGGVDYHTNTLALLKTLSSYSWEAKMVMALSAFGVNYGEFWLMTQFYPISLMEQYENVLRSKYEDLNNLIKVMLHMTKLIVEFQELPLHCIINDKAHATLLSSVPSAAYWTIRCVLVCSAEILGLIDLGQEEKITHTSEAEYSALEILEVAPGAPHWELATYGHKLKHIDAHLVMHLDLVTKK